MSNNSNNYIYDKIYKHNKIKIQKATSKYTKFINDYNNYNENNYNNNNNNNNNDKNLSDNNIIVKSLK